MMVQGYGNEDMMVQCKVQYIIIKVQWIFGNFKF